MYIYIHTNVTRCACLLPDSNHLPGDVRFGCALACARIIVGTRPQGEWDLRVHYMYIYTYLLIYLGFGRYVQCTVCTLNGHTAKQFRLFCARRKWLSYPTSCSRIFENLLLLKTTSFYMPQYDRNNRRLVVFFTITQTKFGRITEKNDWT